MELCRDKVTHPVEDIADFLLGTVRLVRVELHALRVLPGIVQAILREELGVIRNLVATEILGMERNEHRLRFKRVPVNILVGVAEVQEPVTDRGATILLGLEHEFHESSLHLVHGTELRLGRPGHEAMEDCQHKREILLHTSHGNVVMPQA